MSRKLLTRKSTNPIRALAGIQISAMATTAGRDLYQKNLLSFRNVCEFLKVSDSSLLGTLGTPAGNVSPTNAQLVALLGGVERSFYLRAKFKTSMAPQQWTLHGLGRTGAVWE